MSYIYDHQDNRDIPVPHKYHEDLGHPEFMKEHYSNDSAHKMEGVIFRVYHKTSDAILNAPNYVVEINSMEMNFICFEMAKDVNDYLWNMETNI